MSHDLHSTENFHYCIRDFFTPCIEPWVSWRANFCCWCKSVDSLNAHLFGVGFQKGDTQSLKEGWMRTTCGLQIDSIVGWCLILVSNMVTLRCQQIYSSDFDRILFKSRLCPLLASQTVCSELLWSLCSSSANFSFWIFKIFSSCPLRFLL